MNVNSRDVDDDMVNTFTLWVWPLGNIIRQHQLRLNTKHRWCSDRVVWSIGLENSSTCCAQQLDPGCGGDRSLQRSWYHRQSSVTWPAWVPPCPSHPPMAEHQPTTALSQSWVSMAPIQDLFSLLERCPNWSEQSERAMGSDFPHKVAAVNPNCAPVCIYLVGHTCFSNKGGKREKKDFKQICSWRSYCTLHLYTLISLPS